MATSGQHAPHNRSPVRRNWSTFGGERLAQGMQFSRGGGALVEIRKVVLCDDDPDIRAIGEISLRDVGGWEVVCVHDGFAAVDAARTERPDVILLDIMMPTLDGPGTFAKLREDPQCREIPVVFMTAKAQSHELRAYTELGAAGVIAKPFDPLTLPDQLRALVEAS